MAEPGGICVSARVRRDAAGKLDLAFDDMGQQQLKNIARPVRAYRVATGLVPGTAQETPALALPDKPSIAVLPFANLSGDREQEYFADGMVEETITLEEVGTLTVKGLTQPVVAFNVTEPVSGTSAAL